MKSLSLVISVALVLGGTACNGGGGRKVSGSQCPEVFKPISMDVGANQTKLSLVRQQEQIPPGKYTYDGSSLYYVDKSNLRVLAHDNKQKDGTTFKGSTGCIRNGKNELHPVAIEGIWSMLVSADKKGIISDVNLFTIGQENGKFKVVSSKLAKTVQSPSDTFVDANAATYFLVETANNRTDYELRSVGNINNGEYYLSIRFKRTDLPLPAVSTDPTLQVDGPGYHR